MERKCGILLHISSLPSKYGIGNLGTEAKKFADFLAESGQSFWQILPLTQTSYGDSPYQSPSAFAGNPYFIDIQQLAEENLLEKEEISDLNYPSEYVDYGALFKERYNTLEKAFERFIPHSEYENFTEKNNFWLEDYAVFMALKKKNGYKSFHLWNKKYLLKNKKIINEFCRKNKNQVDFWKFVQYEFYSQYKSLKEYLNGKGVKIIGDMPIYLALDSAEVWARSENFLLDDMKKPLLIAGVPPDCFSEDGQLWGNPIYDWDYMCKNGYKFWKERIRFAFELYDYVRIDHFRGFESYYVISPEKNNAKEGKWLKGKGIEFFNEIGREIDCSNIIAEDLGFLTEDFRKMLKETRFPGMKVLQFAFDGDEDNEYMPQYHTKNSVVYTGTHDNDTTNSWYNTLSTEAKKLFVNVTGMVEGETPADALIRTAYKSEADLAVILMQDILNLGGESRMNTPSNTTGCWKWRMAADYNSQNIKSRLKSLAEKTNRL
jgi:4-alpha-glucanotransferase